jgi:hypothetical protein
MLVFFHTGIKTKGSASGTNVGMTKKQIREEVEAEPKSKVQRN